VLDDSQTAPVSVDTDGVAFACSAGDCGRRMFRRTTFTVGSASLLLAPGKSDFLRPPGQTYEAVAVGNYSEEASGCQPSPVVPHVVIWQAPVSP
jgi:hypothetical protein